jgi:mannitol-specific phosphotransferase system IIBC component
VSNIALHVSVTRAMLAASTRVLAVTLNVETAVSNSLIKKTKKKKKKKINKYSKGRGENKKKKKKQKRGGWSRRADHSEQSMRELIHTCFFAFVGKQWHIAQRRRLAQRRFDGFGLQQNLLHCIHHRFTTHYDNKSEF